MNMSRAERDKLEFETMRRFEKEALDEGSAKLFAELEGCSIVSVEKVADEYGMLKNYKFVLDNGRKFVLKSVGKCCAYAEIEKLSVHTKMISNVITDVRVMKRKSEVKYETALRWFFLTDMSETVRAENKAMAVDVVASAGTGCYTFGFDVEVVEDFSK